jgi:hypothetical protein
VMKVPEHLYVLGGLLYLPSLVMKVPEHLYVLGGLLYVPLSCVIPVVFDVYK